MSGVGVAIEDPNLSCFDRERLGNVVGEFTAAAKGPQPRDDEDLIRGEAQPRKTGGQLRGAKRAPHSRPCSARNACSVGVAPRLHTPTMRADAIGTHCVATKQQGGIERTRDERVRIGRTLAELLGDGHSMRCRIRFEQQRVGDRPPEEVGGATMRGLSSRRLW